MTCHKEDSVDLEGRKEEWEEVEKKEKKEYEYNEFIKLYIKIIDIELLI